MAFNQLFLQWIEGIISNNSPNESIIAYNFGIFQTPSSYSIYLIGTSSYDLDDDDWASNLDEFNPPNSYLELPEVELKDLTWEEVLPIIVGTITKFCESDVFKQSFLSRAEVISTGFDDGNLVIIKQ